MIKRLNSYLCIFLSLMLLTFPISSFCQSGTPIQVAGTATHTALSSGNWSDASTWGGSLPTTDARVLIPANVKVTVDTEISTEFKSVRIAKQGILTFAPHVNTELRTEFLVSEPPTKNANGDIILDGGKLEIGSTSNRIDPGVRASLVFAERGGSSKNEDPQRFAPGAVLMGKTTMHGAEKTAWLALATQPSAGATQLSLKSTPIGWQVGDQLVIAGTDLTDYASDEVVTISAISSNTITISPALSLDHKAPAEIANLVDIHVANLSRNIIVSSENPSVSAIGGDPYRKPRGHMMFMHTLDVELTYMSSLNTGRTDKRIELDDWSAEGLPREPQPLPPIPNGYKNPRGRYSIHFHRGGTSPSLTPALVEGCVVNNDPGWAFTNHSARVDFVKNVSYDVVGSGFCTESGNETGSFIENFAVRTYNPDEPMNIGRPSDPLGDRTEALADARENLSDFAWQGDGFWFHSTGITVEGNVVAGCTGHAFVYWSEGLIENNLGIARGQIDTHVPANEFPALNAELKAWQQTHPYWNFDIWYILARPFRNNTAYNMCRGVHGYYIMTTFHEAIDFEEGEEQEEFNLMPPGYRAANKLTIENTTLWGMRRIGMGFNHCAQIELKNNQVYGYGTSSAIAPWTSPQNEFTPFLEVEPAVIGMDLDFYHNDRNWRLENNTIKGFEGSAIALALPANADVEVAGGIFDNGGIDIKIREVNWKKNWDELVVSFDDDDMDPLPLDKTVPWRRITIEGNIQFLNSNQNIVLDPQFHLTNPSQDAFGILDGSVKMSGYFLLPDDIRLNFGPFNNAKVYFNEQEANFIPATSTTQSPLGLDPSDVFPEEITPSKYLNKSNQQLQNQYALSFGGELLPMTAVSHPMLIGGKVNATTTSSRDLANKLNIEIYPNPSNGIFQLAGEFKDYTIQILSVNGAILKRLKGQNGLTQIDINSLPAGLYLVKVLQDKEGLWGVKKIIKTDY
ncbi:MAG: T9SS type A sorting domain-containing protein [Bacteroidota bacterium]